jgi:LysR family transcriptional regulator, transcriptional activator of nhaA
MDRLNYHHLYYFWRVAKLGKLTQAAEDLRVSQSALSTQIRQLEDMLGQELFTRSGRRLILTEAGRMAFTYADEIFRRGDELMALMTTGERPERLRVRIGAVATLSRNFQEEFIAPLLERKEVELVLQSGRIEDLLKALSLHSLDLVLSNVPVRRDAENPWRCRRIARQQVSVIGKPGKRKTFRLPAGLVDIPLILPGNSSDIRSGFDALCERWDLTPRIRAEVDDMAMLRLLVRDSDALAILPKVVVRDEIKAGLLEEYAVLPDVHENFYAISIKRQFESPLVKELLTRPESQMLAPGSVNAG